MSLTKVATTMVTSSAITRIMVKRTVTQTVATATVVVSTFPTVIEDLNGDWDAASSTFTAPTTGLYSICACETFVNPTPSGICAGYIRWLTNIGTNTIKQDIPTAMTDGGTNIQRAVGGSHVIYMTAGERIRFIVTQFGGSNGTIGANSWMTIGKVSI